MQPWERVVHVVAGLSILVGLLAGCCSEWSWDNHAPVIRGFLVNGRCTDGGGVVLDCEPEENPNGEADLTVTPGSDVLFVCMATDPDRDPLTYTWMSTSPSGGEEKETADQTFTWRAPNEAGVHTISCAVEDGRGGIAAPSATVEVKAAGQPLKATLALDPATIEASGEVMVTCTAEGGDGAEYTYKFLVDPDGGTIVQDETEKNKAKYTGPQAAGEYSVYCVVSDASNNTAVAGATVTVQAASQEEGS